MLESVLTSILNQYLGKFVENLDGSQLKLGLFSGKLTLRNVAVRPDALSSLLDLPVRVIAGNIGTINLDIPLSALRSKPIVVQADEVYLLVSPQYSGVTPVTGLVRTQKQKLESLQLIEKHFVVAQTTGAVSALGSSNAGTTGSNSQDTTQMYEGMLATAVSNLQLRVTRIHIRYEHPIGRVPNPFSNHTNGIPYIRSAIFGLSIAEISILTTNDKWVVEFVKNSQTIYKLGTVQGVSIYLDTVVQAAPFMAGAEMGGIVKPNSNSPDNYATRSLEWMRHIFETQSLLRQIQVDFPESSTTGTSSSSTNTNSNNNNTYNNNPDTSQRGASRSSTARSFLSSGSNTASNSSLLSSSSGSGSNNGGLRTLDRNETKAYANFYSYILAPVSLTAKASFALGFPLSRPKVIASIIVEDISVSIADRQYSVLMRILTDHNSAWEARQLGLSYRDLSTSVLPDSTTHTHRNVKGTVNSLPEFRFSSRRRLMDNTTNSPSVRNLSKTSPSRVSLWARLFSSLVLRYRASIRERERHSYLAAVTVDYARLYMRRLTATESLNMPNLTPGERRRYESMETDPRLTYDDVMALRRGAERWVREQLKMPLVDIQRRRAVEIAAYSHLADTATASLLAKASIPVSSNKGGTNNAFLSPSGKSIRANNKAKYEDETLSPRATRSTSTSAAGLNEGGILGRWLKSKTNENDGMTTEDMAKLYDSLGYEMDMKTGTVIPRAGTELAAAAAEAITIANHGLPRSYIWLRLAVEIKNISLTLLEHNLNRFSTNTNLNLNSSTNFLNRGLLGSAAIPISIGTLSTSGTLREVTKLSISRSSVGVDVKAFSWSAGLDLGDVTVIDCGIADSHNGPSDHKKHGSHNHASNRGLLGGSQLGNGELLHRYIIFSDHSRESGTNASTAGAASTASSGIPTGKSIGSKVFINRTKTSSNDADINDNEIITEASICIEDPPNVRSTLLRGSNSYGDTTAAGLRMGNGTGGGGLSANPVRTGLVSVRLVGNPEDEDEEEKSDTVINRPKGLNVNSSSSNVVSTTGSSRNTAPVTKKGSSTVPPRRTTTTNRNPYADDSDDTNADSDDDDYYTSSKRRQGTNPLPNKLSGRNNNNNNHRRRFDSDDSDEYAKNERLDEDDKDNDDDGTESTKDKTGSEDNDDTGKNKASSTAVTTTTTSTTDLASVWLKLRVAARPLVIVWSPPYVRRLISWISVADNLESMEKTYIVNTNADVTATGNTTVDETTGQVGATVNTSMVLGMLDNYFSSLVASASVSIEAALVSAKSKVDIKAFVAAPVIVVPQWVQTTARMQNNSSSALNVVNTPTSPKSNAYDKYACPMIILDMGAVSFASKFSSAVLLPSLTTAATNTVGSSTANEKSMALITTALANTSASSYSYPTSSASSVPNVTVAPAYDSSIAVNNLQPVLTGNFDRYAIRVTGISLVLVTRVRMEEEEDYDASSHHRITGTDTLAIIQGTDHSTLDNVVTTTNTNNKTTVSGGTNPTTVINRTPWWLLGSRVREGQDTNIWNTSTLGIPRIVWLRASSHYLARDCTVTADLFVNISGKDMVPWNSSSTTTNNNNINGSIPLSPIISSPTASSTGNSIVIPLPQMFTHVRIENLALNLSTGDLVDIANIGLAAATPFADGAFGDTNNSQMIRPKPSATAAAAIRASSGILVKLFAPFDSADPNFFNFADPRSIMKAAEVEFLVQVKNVHNITSTVQHRNMVNTTNPNPSSTMVNTTLAPNEKHLLVNQFTVSALSLHLSHGSRIGINSSSNPSVGGGGSSSFLPLDDGRTPFDLVLSAENVTASVITFDIGTNFQASVGTLVAYVGAGSAPRGLLLQLGLKTYGTGITSPFTGTTSNHSTTNDRRIPSVNAVGTPPRISIPVTTDTIVSTSSSTHNPTGMTVTRTIFHCELLRAEVSLVRRPQDQLDAQRRAVLWIPPVNEDDKLRTHTSSSNISSKSTKARSSTLLNTNTLSSYASIMAELKADATYLFAPLQAHITLLQDIVTKAAHAADSRMTRPASGTNIAESRPVPPSSSSSSSVKPVTGGNTPTTSATDAGTNESQTRILARIGSAVLSVSPLDAALLVALADAVQAGIVSVLEDVTDGLSAYFQRSDALLEDESSSSEEDDDNTNKDEYDDDYYGTGDNNGGDNDRNLDTDINPELADAAAALALSLKKAGIANTAQDGVSRVTNAMLQVARRAADAGNANAKGSMATTLSRTGTNDTFPVTKSPAFELRVVCDCVQVTLYSNANSVISTSSQRSSRSKNGGNVPKDVSDSALPTYRTQVLRLSIASIGVRFSEGTVSILGRLGAQYFNESIITWEPVLDPWPFTLNVAIQDGTMTTTNGTNTTSTSSKSASTASPVIDLQIMGNGGLNFTASTAFLETLPSINAAMEDILSAISTSSGDNPGTDRANSSSSTNLPTNALTVSAGTNSDGDRGGSKMNPQGSPNGKSVAGNTGNSTGNTNDTLTKTTVSPLAYAPFILINETGCMVQVWRPDQGAILGQSKVFEEAPEPALISTGEHFPISATFLALLEQEEINAEDTDDDLGTTTGNRTTSKYRNENKRANTDGVKLNDNGTNSIVSAQLDRALPPPSVQPNSDELDLPIEFQVDNSIGVLKNGFLPGTRPSNVTVDSLSSPTIGLHGHSGHHQSTLAELKRWYKPSDGTLASDIISGSVSVTLNLQIAGYRPLVKQPVNRTGKVQVTLQPLQPNQIQHRGIRLLRPGATRIKRSVSTNASSASLHEMDEEEEAEYRSNLYVEEVSKTMTYADLASNSDDDYTDYGRNNGNRYDSKGGSTDSSAALLRAWKKTVTNCRNPGAAFPLHLEVTVENGSGGCKFIRLRSLVQLHNSTRIPVVVRLLPQHPYGLDHVTAEEAVAQMDNSTGQLANAMRQAYIASANRRQRGDSIDDNRSGTRRSSSNGNDSYSDKRALFASSNRTSFRDVTNLAIEPRAINTTGSSFSSKKYSTLETVSTTESPIPSSFTIPCWDAAAGGLPLDRVIMPGQVWRLPLPYAKNTRIFLKPAITLPYSILGDASLTVASDEDDGHCTIKVPYDSNNENNSGTTPILGIGGRTNGSSMNRDNSGLDLHAIGEHDDGDNDEPPPSRRINSKGIGPKGKGKTKQSSTTKGKKLGIYDEEEDEEDDSDNDHDNDDDDNDDDTGDRWEKKSTVPTDEDDDNRSETISDIDGDIDVGEDEEEEEEEDYDAYVADPRFEWSAFERADTDPDDNLIASDDASNSSSLPGVKLLSQMGKLMRRRSVTGNTEGEESSSTTGTKTMNRSTMENTDPGVAHGLDIDNFTSNSLNRILSDIYDSSTGRLNNNHGTDNDGNTSPSSDSNPSTPSVSDSSPSSSSPVLNQSSSRITTKVAVCGRSRQRTNDIALNTNDNASDGNASSSATSNISSMGASTSVILSHAFYYVSARAEMVPLASGSGSGASNTLADYVNDDTYESGSKMDPMVQRAFWITQSSSRVTANVTFIIRSPVELQNTLACDMAYEIAVPKWLLLGTSPPVPVKKKKSLFKKETKNKETKTGKKEEKTSTDKNNEKTMPSNDTPSSKPPLVSTPTKTNDTDPKTTTEIKRRGIFSRFSSAKKGNKDTPTDKETPGTLLPTDTDGTAKNDETSVAKEKDPKPIPGTPVATNVSGSATGKNSKEESDDNDDYSTDEEETDDPQDEMVVIATGVLCPAQSLSLLYAHPDPPLLLEKEMNTSLADTTNTSRTRRNNNNNPSSSWSRSRYRTRLTAARHVRSLSVRMRLPDTGFQWSNWIGLWSIHGSETRLRSTEIQTAAHGTLQILRPLPLPANPQQPAISSVLLRDGTGEVCALHTEHAITSVTHVLPTSGNTTEESTDDTVVNEGNVPDSSSGGEDERSRSVTTETLTITLFCKFWMVNATGMPIAYSSGLPSQSRSSHGVKVAPGQAQPITIETYENERYLMLKWQKNMLPTDRESWSDRHGRSKKSLPMSSFRLPSKEWSWNGPWQIDTHHSEVDTEGWQYHVDFPRGSNDNGWSGKRTPLHSVRRRRWIRTMLPPSIYASLGTLGGNTAVNDNSDAGTVRSGMTGGIRSSEAGSSVFLPGFHMSNSNGSGANASMLLAVGVYMYGPVRSDDENCSLRIGESEWSNPFPLRGVGRPSLVVVKEKKRSSPVDKGSSDPKDDTTNDDNSVFTNQFVTTGQSQFEFAVSSQPCTYNPFGPAFWRTMVVTVSPRFLFVNHLDPYIAAAFRYSGHNNNTGNGNTAVSSGPTLVAGAVASSSADPLDDVGMYVLQITQASYHHPSNGISRPSRVVQEYLASIAAPGGHSETEYDIGKTLEEKLRLSNYGTQGFDSTSPNNTSSSSHCGYVGRPVPYVLSVPPGEHAPFYWSTKPVSVTTTSSNEITTDTASERVCFRIVRLMRRTVTLPMGSSSVRGQGRSSFNGTSSHTVVVPVTEWSGAVDLNRVNETPVRLTPVIGSQSRLDTGVSEVVLRVSVRSHKTRGTAIILVTADGSLSNISTEIEGGLQEEEEEEETKPKTGFSSSVYSITGNAGSIVPLKPVLWETGVGEVDIHIVRHRYARYMKQLTALAAATAKQKAGTSGAQNSVIKRSAWLDVSHTSAAAMLQQFPPPPPLYRIDNHSLDTFRIVQKGLSSDSRDGRQPLIVPPRTSVLFAWSEPTIPAPFIAAALLVDRDKARAAADAIAAQQAMEEAEQQSQNGITSPNKTTALMKRNRDKMAAKLSGMTVSMMAKLSGNDKDEIIVQEEERLRITVIPYTLPLSSTENKLATTVTSTSLNTDTLDINFENFAQTCSIELPPGRVLDEELLENSSRGTAAAVGLFSPGSPGRGNSRNEVVGFTGPGNSSTSTNMHSLAKPVHYGAAILLRSRQGGNPWAIGAVIESRSLWPIAETADGWYTAREPGPRKREKDALPVWPSGSMVYSAQCRLGIPEHEIAAISTGGTGASKRSVRNRDNDGTSTTAGSGGIPIIDPSVASGGVPFVFEHAGSLFAYPGFPKVKPQGRSNVSSGTGGGGRGRSSSFDILLQSLENNTITGPNGVLLPNPMNNNTNRTVKEVRYGDLVFIRHDAVVSNNEEDMDDGDYDEDYEEGTMPGRSRGGGEVTAARQQPLYLVCHRDGKIEWLQREAAMAVSRNIATITTTSMTTGSTATSSSKASIFTRSSSTNHGSNNSSLAKADTVIPACSVFLVVGGKPGHPIKLSRSTGASTVGDTHHRNSNNNRNNNNPSYDTDNDSEDSDNDNAGSNHRNSSSSSSGSSHGGFGLLPIGFIDRLLECTSAGENNSITASAAASIRQCRLPALSPATMNPSLSVTVDEGNNIGISFGDTDQSSSNRNLSLTSSGNENLSSVPTGGRIMSAMQRKRLAARGIKVDESIGGIHSLATLPLPSTGIPTELRTGINGGLRTVNIALGDATRSQLAAAQDIEIPTPDPETVPNFIDLLRAVYALPFPSTLPASCVMIACPLTSQTLPRRVIAARVGFDGPTRVLTLQALPAVGAGRGIGTGIKGQDSIQHSSSSGNILSPPSSAKLSNPKSSSSMVPQDVPTFSSSPNPSPLTSVLSFSVSVLLPELCFSIVDREPQELVLVTLNKIAASLSLAHPYTTAEVTIQDVQIDNQLPMASYPVVLARSPQKMNPNASTSLTTMVTVRPFLHASFVRQAHRVSSNSTTGSGHSSSVASSSSSSSVGGTRILVEHFPYLSLLIQEMDINLEEALLRRLLDVLPPDLQESLTSGSTDQEDNSAILVSSNRRSGGLIIGADVSKGNVHGSSSGGAFAPFSGLTKKATDSLAGSIVKAAGKKRIPGPVGNGGWNSRGSSSSFGTSSQAISRILGQETATRLKQRTARVKSRMRKDMVKLKDFQNQGTKYMQQMAHNVTKSTTDAFERGTNSLVQNISAVSRRAPLPGKDKNRSRLEGISGPRNISNHNFNRRIPSVTAALARLQEDSSMKVSDSSTMISNGFWGGIDTVASLASDTQWWWPSRMPASDVREPTSSAHLFMQHMVLHSIAFNLSFVRDTVTASMTGNSSSDGNEKSNYSSTSMLTSPLTVTLNAIGVIALSLNRAPVRLNGLELVNVLAGPSDLSDRVMAHYISSALSELYKVLLSFDVLGNPVGVVSALGTGVRDFFVEPAAGIVRSPAEFGKGLTKGSKSLLTGTVVGLGLGVSSITATVGRGVATLAFDDAYVRDRAERAARGVSSRPAHIGEGLLEGTKDLGRGIAQGLAGVILDPLRGAEQQGVTGFMKGVGKGLTGLVVKPVTGVLDLATRATEGMVASAKALAGETVENPIAIRHRPPRLLWGLDRAIIPVEPLHATIVAVMRRALEAAADQAEADIRKLQAKNASSSNKFGLSTKASGTSSTTKVIGSRAMYLDTGNENESAAMSIVSDLRSLITGKEAALRGALANIATSYMHHILWPRSPYLLIITSRAVIFARINRAALGTGRRFSYTSAQNIVAAANQQVIHLCWQTPVVTRTVMEAIAAARGGIMNDHSSRSTKKSILSSVVGVDDNGSAMGDTSIHGNTRQNRSNAPVGLVGGHMMYGHIVDSMAEMCTGAATATEATAALRSALATTGAVNMYAPVVSSKRRGSLLASTYGVKKSLPTSTSSSTLIPSLMGITNYNASTVNSKANAAVSTASTSTTTNPSSTLASKKLRVQSGPSAVMLLDALVQKRLVTLSALGPNDPIFSLPSRLVDAMTVFVDPLPLHWGDAIATLANVRPDEDPQRNIQAVTMSLAYMDSAYVRYSRERASYLQANPDLPGAGEASTLANIRSLDPDDIRPLFLYCMAKATIDRPVLVSILAQAWLMQHGLAKDRDGFAMATFRDACEWAASVPIPNEGGM